VGITAARIDQKMKEYARELSDTDVFLGHPPFQAFLLRKLAEIDLRTTKEKKPPVAAGAWDEWKRVYFLRYNVLPVQSAKIMSALKSLVGAVPGADLSRLMAFYVAHADPFYVRARHPLELLLRDVQRILVDMDTGSSVTRKDAAAGESYDATVAAAKQHWAKKHGVDDVR